MEAFSLLKYWRGGGVTVDGGANTTGTTTIVTSVSHHAAETDEDDDDDGPFFDLELTVPDEDGGDEEANREEGDCTNCEDDGDEEKEDGVESDATDGEEEREFKLTLSSGESGDLTDANASLSPSDDLFFNGRLVPIEPSSIVFNSSESKTKSQCSLLKSATKFRVLMLKLKKSTANVTEKTESGGLASAKTKQQQKQEEPEPQKQKQNQPQSKFFTVKFKKSKANVTEKTESNGLASETPKQQQKQEEPEPQKQQRNQPQSKFFTVKFKVEEVPIVSLFTRDNSSRASSGSDKSQKQQSSDESASEEKRFSKDVMQRYLKMVKPLYVRVSKRYGEKLRFSGQLSLGSSEGTEAGPSPQSNSPPAKSTAAKSESEPTEVREPPPPPPPSNVKSQKLGNLPAGLRVVRKHLGKSRSASSTAAAAASSSSLIQGKRHDDSLLQQQDGIQGAILHCKRSFNASKDSESSLLSRSVSDPSHDKSMNCSTKCSEEHKETGI